MSAPKATVSSKRKGPAFKPPRPVKAPATSTNANKHASGATASKPANTARKAAAPSRPSFAPSLTLISDSEDDDEPEQPLSPSEPDELMDDVLEVEPPMRESLAQPTIDPIPEKLLARLLYEGFDDKDMKINKGAMELVAKYMEIFVREAIARAKFERDDAKGGGYMDGHLQVEDLERLAPQLVLDF